jgi:hypothetical protein
MQDNIKFEILELIKDIHEKEANYICKRTDETLYHIYKDIITNEEVENLSVLYRLIFYAYNHSPIISYEMLSGFVKFGQSDEGNKYKPLLDHLVIEAFDQLLELGGWSILRDCVNTLRHNLINVQSEPIFLHIMSRIVNQLYADEHEPDNLDNLSDICHYLPREKSFIWGWFAFCIVSAYYSINEETLSNKVMRRYLMQYRKLITSLRRIVPTNPMVENDKPYTIASEAEASEAEASDSEASDSEASEAGVSEPTWTEVLVGLAVPEYKWAADLINATMDSTIATVVETKNECTEATVIINELEDLIEKVLVKLQDNIPTEQEEQEEQLEQAQADQSQSDQFLIIPLEEKKEEITQTTTTTSTGGGWFSWLGWS